MAQRGGNVITHVRIGDGVHSPLVEPGGADYLLAFEELEALRALPYLKAGGTLIANTQIIAPMPVITGAATYPDDPLRDAALAAHRVEAVDALALAVAAGSQAMATSCQGISALSTFTAACFSSGCLESGQNTGEVRAFTPAISSPALARPPRNSLPQCMGMTWRAPSSLQAPV